MNDNVEVTTRNVDLQLQSLHATQAEIRLDKQYPTLFLQIHTAVAQMGATGFFCVQQIKTIKITNFKIMVQLQNVIKQLRQTSYMNRWVVFIIDMLLSLLCTGSSLLFISAILMNNSPLEMLSSILFISAICSATSIGGLQIYKGIIRHSGFTEVLRIGMASLLKVLLLYFFAGLFFGMNGKNFLLATAVADMFFTFFILVIVRSLLIIVYHFVLKKAQKDWMKDNILLFSASPQSSFVFPLLQGIGEGYHIAGFLKTTKDGLSRMGDYAVYTVDSESSFDLLIARHSIKAILFPNYADIKEEENRLIRYCEKRKIRMLVLPSVDELNVGRINYRNLPEVRIEDLLGRDEIKINTAGIMDSLKGKVVLVTGAGGSIGSELCRQLCLFGAKELILFDCAETPMHHLRLELEEKFPSIVCHPVMGDIRNATRIKNIFERYMPVIVFHAAAYKHVPLMEENPCEAVCTNMAGTMVVADAAVNYGVDKFVMISTDKAVNPTNVMGASKRLAEIYVQSLGAAISNKSHHGKTRFVTTRFGNVLGSNGSVIPRFREQLIKGGPLTVTDPEIIRYFMTIPEACRLVLEAASIGEGNEIFVFDMGKAVKIDSLARRMIELAGLVPDKDIRIEYTGLRPGEKLYEELLASKETVLPTSNKKIFRAKVREYDYREILPKMRTLYDCARRIEIMETVRQMKEIIPEFKSEHSEFECLDEAYA
jgi:FlaA1/EpsC-like NDP-sugar epimerase